LEEKERDLEVTTLTIKLEESEKRADMVQTFTSGLVRNTIIRKHILDSENIDMPMMYDNSGNQIGGGFKNTTKSYTENKEED